MVALAAAGAVVVAVESRPARESADFTFYYAAATLVREGHPAAVYQQPALDAAIRAAAPDSAVDRRLPFNLPLGAILPLVPLTFMPLDLAFRAWQLIDVVILLAGLLLLQRVHPIGRAGAAVGALALAATVPVWALLSEAQLTPLPTLGGALVIATLRLDQPWLALGGGMLLAIKPHFLPVYLVMLVAARRWRALLAASAGAGALLLSSLAAGGFGGIRAMVENALATGQRVPVRLTEAWTGILAHAIPSTLITPVSLGLYLGTLGVLAVLALQAARRGGLPIALIVLMAWIGMLSTPHVLPHDLLLLAPPTWLVFRLVRAGRMPSPVLALVLVDLAILLDLRGGPVVVAPLAMTAVTVWAIWAFRRRAARRQSQPAAAAA